mgnify:CR=1 FL=1
MKLNDCMKTIIARRRAPHGARGLKLLCLCLRRTRRRRAPHGARGLKPENMVYRLGFKAVAPHTGRVD